MKKILLFFLALPATLFVLSSSGVALATTVLVNKVDDAVTSCTTTGTGPCTLRDAIAFLNNNPGTGDRIDFADSICSSGCTIAPGSALPDIADPNGVFINGYSVTGSKANTLAVGDDAVLKVVLDGGGAGNSVSGLKITTDGCLIRGLVVQNFGGTGFGNGILISGGSGNHIEGNFLGTDAGGTKALGNTDAGVMLLNGATGNTVGGSSPAARNLVSGNKLFGVATGKASDNTIQGNYIGTEATGTLALGNNLNGVSIDVSSNNNSVGGASPGEGNLISGNGSGIAFGGGSGNIVQGNLIGTDASGLNALPNLGDGVKIAQGSALNTVGGSSEGEGNRIAFNNGHGVSVGFVGLTGSNVILGNSIFSNGGLGIDLNVGGLSDGVTANDEGDADTGANNFQNFPDLSSAVVANGSLTLQGSLQSGANAYFRIEFFAGSDCDASGHGEGQTFLGAIQPVGTDGSGNVVFNAEFPPPAGLFITATATNLGARATSEFSACLKATALVEDCVNGTDDDGEGLVDCADPNCGADPVCLASPAPTTGGCGLTGSTLPASGTSFFLLIPLLIVGWLRKKPCK